LSRTDQKIEPLKNDRSQKIETRPDPSSLRSSLSKIHGTQRSLDSWWGGLMDNRQHVLDLDEIERRQWTVAEEDLPPCITTRRQPGEHRWFRSDNVVCLEQWRRKKAQSTRMLPDGHGKSA
jgi:hypothetical protein